MTKSELIKQKLDSHKKLINFLPLAYWLIMALLVYWASNIGVQYDMGFDIEYFAIMIVKITVMAGIIWLFRWRIDYGLFNVAKLIKLDTIYIKYPILSLMLIVLLLFLFGTIAIIILMLLSIPDSNLK